MSGFSLYTVAVCLIRYAVRYSNYVKYFLVIWFRGKGVRIVWLCFLFSCWCNQLYVCYIYISSNNIYVKCRNQDFMMVWFSSMKTDFFFKFQWLPCRHSNRSRSRRGRDIMVVEFTTTYAITAYHHWCCEFESWSGRGVQHYVIQFASDLWQVGVFLRVFRFPPSIKLTATI